MPEAGVRVRIPPPVLFFLFLGSGTLAGRIRPFPIGLETVHLRLAVALPLFLASAAFAAWALATLAGQGASPNFRVPVVRLVTAGPYARSRNPLYVALVATLATFSALLDNGWILIAALAAALVLDRFVIAIEERYLRGEFARAYDDYCARVRRWL